MARTRVDFYLLDTPGESPALMTACRLAEKAIQRQQHVFVRVTDARQLRDMGAALWGFRADAFLPHGLVGAEGAPIEPVWLGVEVPADERLPPVMINLDWSRPSPWERFGRVLEIVPAEPALRAGMRVRFREYRKAGIEPNTHELAPRQ